MAIGASDDQAAYPATRGWYPAVNSASHSNPRVREFYPKSRPLEGSLPDPERDRRETETSPTWRRIFDTARNTEGKQKNTERDTLGVSVNCSVSGGPLILKKLPGRNSLRDTSKNLALFRCRKVLLVNEFCVFAILADRGPFMPQRQLPIKRPPSRQRHFLYLSAWRVIVAQSADYICRTWSSHYNEERPLFLGIICCLISQHLLTKQQTFE